MRLFSEENLAAGGSRGSFAKSAGFRLRLEILFQRLILVVCVALTATQSFGIDGSHESLPIQVSGMPPVVSRSGLSYRVDSLWVYRGGYRPLQFDFRVATAKPKDLVIDVTLFAGDYRRSNKNMEAMTVKKRFVLPAGQTTVSGVVLLPWLDEWNSQWWEVAVDGKKDPLLASQINLRAGNSTLSTITPRVATRSSPRKGAEIGHEQFVGGFQVDELFCDAPHDWLLYSGADVIFIGHSLLKQLAEKQTEGFLALRRALRAGSSLWVTKVMYGKKGLKQIEQILGADDWDFGVVDSHDSKPIEGAPGWHYESLAKKSSDQKQAIRELVGSVLEGDLAGVASGLSEADSRGWYAMRSYGFGRVMAFSRSPYDAPASSGRRGKGIAVGKWKQRNWPARHGLSSSGTSRSFGNWLIPGVGIAPVTEFQFLITLFVLAIGPLNYWLLQRSKRLHLLVVTTPLAALVVTTGLFAYALLSDGFGVKTRARSVTLLNQVAGEATSWSRVSQYATSTPEGGYVFPGDAAIYPILPIWGVLGGQETTAREVVWRDGEQHLERGWLPTRTAVQHLIVRSRATLKEIRFSAKGKEASNRLGANVELLLVHGDSGEWLRAEKMADGAVARLEAIKKPAAVAEMRLLVTGNQPEFPIGAGDEAEETLYRFDDRSSRRRRSHLGRGDLSENMLNDALARLSGLDGSKAFDLPPRSYVAVTRQAVETPLGLRVADDERIPEIGSFHVTVGRW